MKNSDDNPKEKLNPILTSNWNFNIVSSNNKILYTNINFAKRLKKVFQIYYNDCKIPPFFNEEKLIIDDQWEKYYDKDGIVLSK